MRCLFACLLLSIFALLAPMTSLADDFRDGVRAYNKKDFSQALKLWLPLARQGNTLVQTLVGSMYAYGEGTERDDKEAVKWFTRAAKQGSVQAQYNLGIMYEQGFGIDKDLNEARRWLLAAAEQGREDARKRLDSLPASPVASAATGQPPTAKPVAIVSTRTGANVLPGSPKTVKNLNTQPASLAPATVEKQQPAASPAPDTVSAADALAGSTEFASASPAPVTVIEQHSAPASTADIETDEDDLASTPPITITLDTLFANIIVEQAPDSAADIESVDDDFSNTPSITIRFDTLLAGKVPATPDAEQILPSAPEPAPEPEPAIETKTDELLGPPDIETTADTDASLNWLNQQPRDYYTIQLAASVEKQLIDSHMKEIPLTGPIAQIMSKRNDQTWHAIIYGSFASFNDAMRELEALPAKLRSWQPWIRPFDSIRQHHKEHPEKYTGQD